MSMACAMSVYTRPISGGSYKIFHMHGPCVRRPEDVRTGDLCIRSFQDRVDVWVRYNDYGWARVRIGVRHPVLSAYALGFDDQNLPVWEPLPPPPPPQRVTPSWGFAVLILLLTCVIAYARLHVLAYYGFHILTSRLYVLFD
ncbi:hypothetical protein AURDEDRAFT_176800 [Auricularia subglabra TFB-10046 SS5]|uniref:Uncharacterized protein n=1 Tax=Auricularia subglabra (strain TFB-10046 / SS5) TaxID=717982 RepID=J0WP18_AURST|nr:hypothetical protein AURDEDRAFT_176800 [Auricularia subglabra TFB-10046 SS5]